MVDGRCSLTTRVVRLNAQEVVNKLKAEKTLNLIRVVAVFCLICCSNANADDSDTADENYDQNIASKFVFGVGIGYERFDTNIKIFDLSSGRDVFVDMEGTLGLPEKETIPLIYGTYRPSKKHGFGWSYFRVKRDTNLIALDENLGDLNVTGNVTLSDHTSFYYVSYNYTLFEDERAVVFANLGLYGLDLKYVLRAEGDITYRNIPITSGEFERNINQFAPLPLVGINSWFALTPKWAMGAQVSVVGGSYNDISAFVLSSKIRARYSLSEHWALNIGVNYLDADVTVDDTDRKTDIRYGFSGFAAGFDYRF